jgi:ABC-type Mn2+/Zn2+ transport system permease subunit
LLGFVVSVASKSAGALLVFCYLVVAPSAGLIIGKSLATVFIVSLVISIFATIAGLFISFSLDFPASQMITIALCGLLLIASLIKRMIRISG